MNERMRINPAEAAAAAAGEADARSLAEAMLNAEEGDNPSELMSDALAEIIGLAVENRIEECQARLAAFCDLIGQLLHQSAKAVLANEAFVRSDKLQPNDRYRRAIDAIVAICEMVSNGRIIAAHPKDDDAVVSLAELQLAVQALGLIFTETEGGEL